VVSTIHAWVSHLMINLLDVRLAAVKVLSVQVGIHIIVDEQKKSYFFKTKWLLFFNAIGHMGHVELLLSVYNPFMIDKLLKLLRA